MATKATADQLEGPVLDVLPALLEQGRLDEVFETVRALVARNEELETLLAELNPRSPGRTRLGGGHAPSGA